MIRSKLFGRIVIILSLLCLPSAVVADKKPNILLILADDIGQGDLPAYFNSSAVSTPNIDALIEKGLMFTDTHSTPLCATSRYMLLSGNYQHRGRHLKGTWSINQNHNNFRTNQKSIAQVLRDDAGYNTGMFGKWHIGGKVPPNGAVDVERILSSNHHDWTLPLGDGPQDIGFDTSYITSEGIQNPPYAFFRNGMLEMQIGTEKYWMPGKYRMPHGQSKILHSGEGSTEWDSTAYNMILVNETEKFIDDHIQQRPSEPFFAYVALGSVHIPHSPPDYYIDKTPIASKYSSPYLSMIFEMDMVVGSLVDIIESHGIEEDTIIIFTSDNGGLKGLNTGTSDVHSSSGELRGNKGMIYEGGHRVPMIWRYDGVYPEGKQRTHMVGLNDIFATLCDIAGIPKPAKSGRDSVSFADYLISDTNTANLRTYLGNWKLNGKYIETGALRKNNMKIIQNFVTSTVELYDLDKDLSEKNDLSSDMIYSGLINAMVSKLARIGPCRPDKKKKFEVMIGAERKLKGCRWILRKRNKRCSKYGSVARRNCPTSCGRHFKFCERLP